MPDPDPPAGPVPRVFAVVPACGRSRRMGVPKLALPLGRRSVLEHVVSALAAAPLARTLVVVGPASPPPTSFSCGPTLEVLVLAEQTADMRATVEAGLRHLARTEQPGPNDAFLLALADQPTITASTVSALVAAHTTQSGRVRVPVFQGRRGHPVLFPWSLADTIPGLPAGRGLDALLESHPDLIVEMPVDSPDVLGDLDDPSDYERLRQRPWD